MKSSSNKSSVKRNSDSCGNKIRKNDNLIEQYIEQLRAKQFCIDIDKFLDEHKESNNEELRSELYFAVFLEEVIDKARSKPVDNIDSSGGKKMDIRVFLKK